MATTSDHIGNHAQTQLRQAIAINGNDWDRESKKRAQMILDIAKLDQTIADYEQRHREYSAALAILEAVLPKALAQVRRADAPATAEEFNNNTLTPNRTAALYEVTVTPAVHKEGPAS